jgi:hypothetical protein
MGPDVYQLRLAISFWVRGNPSESDFDWEVFGSSETDPFDVEVCAQTTQDRRSFSEILGSSTNIDAELLDF